MKWFYRFLPVVLILLFSLFACQKLLTDKFYTSHDGEGHVIRMVEFHEAIMDNQIPVRLAKHINNGLGYPFFNFNYPLIYYMGEAIHLSGASYVASFKILLFLSVFLGGVGMYFFLKKHLDGYGAMTGAIFYILVPYRFLNMYVRGNIAETTALALFPFFFLSIDLLFTSHKKRYAVFSIVFALLILSHNITAMLSLIFGTCYFLFRLAGTKQKVVMIKHTIFALFFSLLLTAFFWIPVVLESHLTRLSELMSDYKEFFPSLQEIVYSPWGFGGYKMGESPGKMSPQIGLLQQAVILLSLGLLLLKKITKKKWVTVDFFLIFFLCLFFTSVFLMLPVSQFLWDSVVPLQLVQLPWRFLGYTSFGAAVAAGYVITRLPQKTYKVIGIVVFSLILLYTNRNHIAVNQYVAFTIPFSNDTPYGPSTTSRDEHMPVWAPRVYTDPEQHGEVFPPEVGNSHRMIWKSNVHVFAVQATQAAQFRDNTSFYPGWSAKINGKDTDIIYTKDGYGRLLINLPKGIHTVEFFFKETPSRFLADMISIVSFIVLLAWLIRNRISS